MDEDNNNQNSDYAPNDSANANIFINYLQSHELLNTQAEAIIQLIEHSAEDEDDVVDDVVDDDVVDDDGVSDSESESDDDLPPLEPSGGFDPPDIFPDNSVGPNQNDYEDNDEAEEEEEEYNYTDDDEEPVTPPIPGNNHPYQQYFSYNRSNIFLKNANKIRVGMTAQAWLYNKSLTKFEAETEEDQDQMELMRTINLTTLAEQVSQIFDLIPQDIKDDPGVINYISETSTHLQYVLDHMSQYDFWEFESDEVFLWITLMEACRRESKVIPFLVNHPKFSIDLIYKEGIYGISCLRFSCMNETSESMQSLLSLDDFNPCKLKEPDSEGYSAVMWAAAYSPFVTEFIISSELVSKDEFFQGVGDTDIDPFMLACEIGSSSASMILKSSYMTKEIFEKPFYKGYTCLMAAIKKNIDIAKDILSHEWCTEEFVKKVDTQFQQMAFHIACYTNPDGARHFLTTDYATTEIIKHRFKSSTNAGISTNCIIVSIAHTDLFKDILNHKNFDKSILTEQQQNTVFFDLCTNAAIAKIILDSDYCDEDLLKTKDLTGRTLFLFLAHTTRYIKSLEELIKHEKFTSDMFQEKNDVGQGIFHVIQRNSATYGSINAGTGGSKVLIKLILSSNQITKEILDDNVEDILKIAALHPEIILDLVDKLSEDIIKKKINATNIPLYVYLATTCDLESFKSLLNHNVFSKKENIHNDQGSLLFAIMGTINMDKVTYLLESDICSHEVFDTTYEGGNTILMQLISNTTIPVNLKLECVNRMIEMEKCQTMINKENDKHETPFMLSLEKCFEIAKVLTESDKLTNGTKLDTDSGISYLNAAIKSKNLDGVKVVTKISGFSNEIYSSIDGEGNNCLHYAAQSSSDIFTYLINVEYFSSPMLMVKNNNNEIPLIISVAKKPKIAVMLFEKDLVSKEMINFYNGYHHTSFHVAALCQRPKLVDLFLKSPHMSKEIMESIDTDGNTLFDHKSINDPDMNKIVQSNHFDVSMVMRSCKKLIKNENSASEYSTTIMHSFLIMGMHDTVKTLIKKFADTDLLSLQDQEKNSVFNYAILSKSLFDTILEVPYLSETHLESKGSDGQNCLMNMVQENRVDHINKILKHQKCRSELITAKDSNGNTILSYIPMESTIFTSLLETGFITGDMIDTFKDSNDNNFLTHLYIINPDECLAFVQSQYFKGTQISHISNDICVMALIVNDDIKISAYNGKEECTNELTHIKIFKQFLESDKVDDSVFNMMLGKKYNTPLLYNLIKSPLLFKTLIQSNRDLSPTFQFIKENKGSLHNLPFYTILALMEFDAFKITVNSKYFDHAHFLIGDKYGHNTITWLCELSLENVEFIINNDKLWTEESQLYGDIDNDRTVMFLIRNPETLQLMIDSDKVTQAMLDACNNSGWNILHHIANHDSIQNFNILTDSGKFDIKSILSVQDCEGNTPFHIACIKSSDITEWYIKNGFATEDSLCVQNNRGETPLAILIKNKSSYVKNILELDTCTSKIFRIRDYQMNSCLMNCIDYMPSALSSIVSHKNFDPLIYSLRNVDNDTCALYAIKKDNVESLNFLLKQDKVSTVDLSYMHSDMGSGLTLAARTSPKSLKLLLNWEKVNWKLVMSVYENRSFMQNAAQYSPEAVS